MTIDPSLYSLLARWPLFVAAATPFLLTTLVTTAFFVMQRTVSHAPADTLQETTREWVQRHIGTLGLSHLRVGPSPPGDAAIDAFWPHVNYIMLKSSTLSRRDPTFWAIGAHELGHALHMRTTPWSTLFPLGRAAAHAFARLSIAALVAHAVLGDSATAIAAWLSLAVALLADGVILTDEAWASHTAWRLLRADGQLNATQMRRAGASLLGAMGAYVAGALARLSVWLALPWLLATAIGPVYTQTQALSTTELWLAVGLSAFLLVQAVRVGFRIVRPKRLSRLSDLGPHTFFEAMADVAGSIGALGLISLLWDHPGPGLALALLLSSVPVLRPVGAVLSHLFLLPVQVMVRQVVRSSHQDAVLFEGAVPADHLPPVLHHAPPTLSLLLHNDRPWSARAVELLRVAHLPLIALFWLDWTMGWVS